MTRNDQLHRFRVRDGLVPGSTIDLSETQSRQIRNVLRLKILDEIILFDGSGQDIKASIVRLTGNRVAVQLDDTFFPGLVLGSPEIHLGMALIKSDRFDLVVQKAVEIGASAITPVVSERCVVRLPADRIRSRLERWRRIVDESLEQSGRSEDVRVAEPISLSEALGALRGDSRLIAYERERSVRIDQVLEPSPPSVIVLIGPEGGFAEHEVDQAVSAGYQPVTLGRTTLRSETAAFVAMSSIRALSSRLGDSGEDR